MDNSSILLLRLLDALKVGKVGIAGLDGYEYGTEKKNYADDAMEIYVPKGSALVINKEISEMLKDFMANKLETTKIEFVTTSRFEEVLKWKI